MDRGVWKIGAHLSDRTRRARYNAGEFDPWTAAMNGAWKWPLPVP
ncbi:hypothetical protein MBELCI_1421 [Limimaricola cinnabarinus LL-001]|uniref:Uncharacterized protein n=1 Tax=Limimaricola cinnabarinus LL-001 TaxID=1337093 RepID=U3ACJ3_9RHOB|nr:hypothetical protein MBELCI_1421 [Limimaricola cinnabarinus LL-001]